MPHIPSRIGHVVRLTHTPFPDATELRDFHRFPLSSSRFSLAQYLYFRNLLFAEYAASLGYYATTSLALHDLRLILAATPRLNRGKQHLGNDLRVWKRWLKHLNSPRPLEAELADDQGVDLRRFQISFQQT